jgi:site-specific DNA recombinase
MRQVVLYTRVSTDDQKEHGFSLQDQERRLREECLKKNYVILHHYQDDHSAKNFNRPAFARFQKDVTDKEVKPDLFLCVRIDRFSRNAEESLRMIAWLKVHGIEFQTLEQNYDLAIPENFLPYILQLALPQVENERRGLNTKRGMRQAMRQGRWMWGAPYGYKNDTLNKRIVIDPVTAPLVAEAFHQFATGMYSADYVRKELGGKGVKMTKQNFLNMLRNCLYAGRIEIKAWKDEPLETVLGIHDAIIEEEVFQQCQDVLLGKRKKIGRPNDRLENLPLRGFLRCAACGGTLTGSNSRSRNGRLHSYYHCQKGCKVRFRAELANLSMVQLLKSFNMIPEAKDLLIEIVRDNFKTYDQGRQKEKKLLEERIKVFTARLDSLNDKYVDELVDPLTYRETKLRYEKERTDLISQHATMQPHSRAVQTYVDFAGRLCTNLSQFFERASYETKRQIVGSIFLDQLVFDGNKYRTTQISEAFQLIATINGHFQDSQKEKAGKIADLSTWAPPALLSSNQFREDLEKVYRLKAAFQALAL